MARGGMVRRHGEVLGCRDGAGRRIGVRQQKAGKAPGKRRLADALASA